MDTKPKIFSVQEDLAFMRKHKDKIVQKTGQKTYDRLVKKLVDHLEKIDRLEKGPVK